jgi:Holliday junction resolvase RusA-like endonuclease
VQAAIDATERDETRPRADMVLTLPFPPSLNTLYATVMTGKGKIRRAKSVRGKDYVADVLWAVRHWVTSTACRPPAPPFRLTIVVYPPRDGQKHDVTNLAKCPEDALMQAIGEDDDDVLEAHIVKHERSATPRIEVRLEHIDPRSGREA